MFMLFCLLSTPLIQSSAVLFKQAPSDRDLVLNEIHDITTNNIGSLCHHHKYRSVNIEMNVSNYANTIERIQFFSSYLISANLLNQIDKVEMMLESLVFRDINISKLSIFNFKEQFTVMVGRGLVDVRNDTREYKEGAAPWYKQRMSELDMKDGWTPPYYSCLTRAWMMSFMLILPNQIKNDKNVDCILVVDINISGLDINQCEATQEHNTDNLLSNESGTKTIKWFEESHKCHNSSKCVFEPGHGWVRGGYGCECKDGFYPAYPTNERTRFNGSLVEVAYMDSLRDGSETYTMLYECKKCSLDCTTCTDNSPCRAEFNWVFRSVLLVISVFCMVVSLVMIILVFCFRHMKVFKYSSPTFLCITLVGCAIMFSEISSKDSTVLICRSYQEIPPYSSVDIIKDSTILICRSHQEIPPYSSVDLIKRFHHTHLTPGAKDKLDTGDADLYRQLFIYLEQLQDLVRLRTKGAEAKPDAGDAALYRQLFIYLEQLQDLVRLMTQGAEAKADTGYAALYRQLFIYLEQLQDLVRLRTQGAEARADTGDSALYRQLLIYLEQLQDLVRLRTQGAEARADTGDVALYRQLFIYLEQLQDLVRLRTLGAEARADTGDAALYRQLFIYLEQLQDLFDILFRVSLTYRVKSAHKLKLTDRQLLQWMCPILLIMIIYLATWSISSPPNGIEISVERGEKFKICEYNWWDHSLALGELVFLLWGVKICFCVRKARTYFDEAKLISWSIYNIAIVNIVMASLHTLILPRAGPDVKYFLGFVRTQLSTTATLILVFGPKFARVIRGKGNDSGESGRGTTSIVGVPYHKNDQMDLYQENEELKEEVQKLAAKVEFFKILGMMADNRHLTPGKQSTYFPQEFLDIQMKQYKQNIISNSLLSRTSCLNCSTNTNTGNKRTASIRRGGNQTLNRTGTRPGSGNGTRTGTGFEAETSGQIRQLKKQDTGYKFINGRVERSLAAVLTENSVDFSDNRQFLDQVSEPQNV
ncbi:probable G-protein coupled receptor CG31760 [Eurytemora carolleeae]|uniref:probable G-protein coupled receptor CG31760 n=1 Tax=Eurytemora carolleeae TaxID=1294199 RepID=UPI000C779FB7|nr:probable G-protein coupled receptor CG31760 [Eurytemora carolleeae]|eukprot:XP_023347925.1 probable G-protein coupled receptor CG31760 [Eurytemora affinis]